VAVRFCRSILLTSSLERSGRRFLQQFRQFLAMAFYDSARPDSQKACPAGVNQPHVRKQFFDGAQQSGSDKKSAPRETIKVHK
jgi:hypothetical protein